MVFSKTLMCVKRKGYGILEDVDVLKTERLWHSRRTYDLSQLLHFIIYL